MKREITPELLERLKERYTGLEDACRKAEWRDELFMFTGRACLCRNLLRWMRGEIEEDLV